QLARLVDPVVTRDAPAEVEALVEGRDLFVSQRSDLPEVEYSSRIECRFELGTDTRDGLEIIRAALRSGEQNVFERLALRRNCNRARLAVCPAAPHLTSVRQDEVNDARRDLGAESGTVEDAVVADVRLFVMRLLVVSEIGAQRMRGFGLTTSGDVVLLAFNGKKGRILDL